MCVGWGQGAHGAWGREARNPKAPPTASSKPPGPRSIQGPPRRSTHLHSRAAGAIWGTHQAELPAHTRRAGHWPCPPPPPQEGPVPPVSTITHTKGRPRVGWHKSLMVWQVHRQHTQLARASQNVSQGGNYHTHKGNQIQVGRKWAMGHTQEGSLEGHVAIQ